ncbi:MAG: ABC-type multidrug transport system, ATPase component [uncultured bacterium]|nr:MAG: ABC-type multidrug transport system, ATPase component [uncultured bacterium]
MSSGEKTRLNLCKSLLNDPKILLLDEPTASLDPVMSRHVMDIIKKLQADKKMTVLYTSHDMDEVEELCQRIIFVNHGKIMAIGSANEVKNKFSLQTLDEVFIHITTVLGDQK